MKLTSELGFKWLFSGVSNENLHSKLVGIDSGFLYFQGVSLMNDFCEQTDIRVINPKEGKTFILNLKDFDSQSEDYQKFSYTVQNSSKVQLLGSLYRSEV